MVRLFMCFSKQSKRNDRSRRRKRNTMPCTNCMAEYTRSRKEHGCSKCGFGFCEKCLNQKVLIPALSPRPVSVCASCYNQQQVNNESGKNAPNPREKNRHFPLPSADQQQQQVWGNGGEGGELPPPSLRSLYTTTQAAKRQQQPSLAGGGGGGSRRENNTKEWSDLEARLQRLNEPIVQDKQQQPAALGEAGSNSSASSTSNGQGKSKSGSGQTIAQLEERLAALRGLPVDVIRKPRLLVTNEGDDDEDVVVLNDDAQALLRQAEAGIRMDRSVQQHQQQRYVDENESASSSRLSVQGDEDDSSSANSSLVRKTINEVTAETSNNNSSSMSDLSSAASSRAQLYPDFAECIKRTMEDAAAAEQEAIDFLRRHGQGQQAQDGGDGKQRLKTEKEMAEELAKQQSRAPPNHHQSWAKK